MELSNELIKVVAGQICTANGLKLDFNGKALHNKKVDNAVIYGAHIDRATASSKHCIYSKLLITDEDHQEFLTDVKAMARKIEHYKR